MRVVLIEPDQTAAETISRMLEARDHEVWQFTDGRDALAFVVSDPDVGAVITASEPRSISGLELCWEMRLIAGRNRVIEANAAFVSSGYGMAGRLIRATKRG